MSRFTGRTAIVTGASRGIGFGVAKQLVDAGARVVLTARNPAPLAEAVAELGGPERAMGIAGKSDDSEHRDEVVTAALREFSSIDMLVNNVGINPSFGPLMELNDDAARKTFEVNVMSALAWTRSVYGAWMAEHGGSVVNVSSMAGERPAPGIAFYGGTKAMLSHLTKELARELAPSIRVNAVAPALIKTQFAGALYEGKEGEVVAPYPMARLGAPGDVAAAVAFLLSDESSWITGHVLPVDGGLSLTGGL